jgi:hypothetical protein
MFDILVLVSVCFSILILYPLSFFFPQVRMATTREKYNIERNKVVKNIPLLKMLKALIDQSFNVEAEKAQILRDLQQAELTEDWDEYETLKTKLTRIEGVHEIVNEGIALTAATNGPNVANELTGPATVEEQGANVVSEGQTQGIRQRATTNDCEEVTVTSLNEKRR